MVEINNFLSNFSFHSSAFQLFCSEVYVCVCVCVCGEGTNMHANSYTYTSSEVFFFFSIRVTWRIPSQKTVIVRLRHPAAQSRAVIRLH